MKGESTKQRRVIDILLVQEVHAHGMGTPKDTAGLSTFKIAFDWRIDHPTECSFISKKREVKVWASCPQNALEIVRTQWITSGKNFVLIPAPD